MIYAYDYERVKCNVLGMLVIQIMGYFMHYKANIIREVINKAKQKYV